MSDINPIRFYMNQKDNPIKTVLLDFHGLMTDNNARLKVSIERACTDLGQVLENFCTFLKLNYSDRGRTESLSKFIKRQSTLFGTENSLEIDDNLIKDLLSRIAYYRDNLYIPVEGLVDTIHKLDAIGVNIIIVTNGSVKKHHFPGVKHYSSYSDVIYDLLQGWGVREEILNKMAIISVRDDLQFYYMSREYGVNPPGLEKPHPVLMDGIARIHAAIGFGNFEPNRTIMVGDYKTDIQFASSLGMGNLLRCAFYLKGRRQIIEGVPEDHTSIYEGAEELLVPVYNVRELPFLCLNPDISRTIVHDEQNELALIEAEDAYRIEVGLGEFNGIKFIDSSVGYEFGHELK